MIVNTREFQREALHYRKHGYYTDAIPGTPRWSHYWHEQKKRCLEGYSVGGTRITGNHYFYLNFYRILRVEQTESITGQKGQVQKIEDFPAFWDGDYNFWWALEIAREGISPEQYKDLGLSVNIQNLSGGMNMVVLKARGKGYSYKQGALLAKNFNLMRRTKCYGFAHLEEYLIKDGLLNKTWDGINFLDQHTAWAQPRLVDLNMHKVSGYKKRERSGFVSAGTQNEIIGVSFYNDANKARGKRGAWIIWEEAGKFPGLVKGWLIAEDSLRAGKYATGTQIAFGTGGSDEQDFADLEELFYKPEAYNVLPFENIWDDEGVMSDSCSYFVPAYQNFEGFMDADGNSDDQGAKAYIQDIREVKKKSGDSKSFDQYVAENPFNPREATLQSTTNLFPVRELLEQYNYVKSRNLHMKMGSHGTLVNENGILKFRPDGQARPIIKFPHKKNDDLEGCITIYEPPIKVEGHVPQNLYLACHDPYDHDSSTTMESLGSTFILKQTNNLSLTFNECIVASYTGRPATQDGYNHQMFDLVEYYNAKLGFENDRGDVIAYARRSKKLHRLQEEFEMLFKKELSSATVRRNYGMHMTPKRSEQGEIYIRDWLNTVVFVGEQGEVKKVLHYIYDLALLQELIKFRQKGNFDRVKALMVGMYHQKELSHKKVRAGEKHRHAEFFQREMFA